jgi:uncharacterized repeat protein (TIGR03803 family)
MAADSRRLWIPALLAACFALVTAPLTAQTYLVIHSLTAASEGNQPQSSLVQDGGGTLYGTTALGGAHGDGTIFKLDAPNGDNFDDIHDFDGTDGSNPYGGVILGGGGFLFGTAANGGNDGAGVIYKIDTSGNNFAVIHHLDGANDGGTPNGGLVQDSQTILYGVAHDNGANGFGTVFSIDPGGQTYAVIHVFGTTADDGSNPYGGLLIGSDGMLYGTTEKGHNGTGLGTVFRLKTDGTGFETLHTFTGGNDGQDPQAPMIETPEGYIYGTTVFGGSGSSGTVFRSRRDGTDYSVVHAFSNADGTDPHAPLTLTIGGLLYGTASSAGGNGDGTVFRMTKLGQLVHSAHDFVDASGSVPKGGVIQGLDGALYGTTSGGGAHSVGTIWRLTTPTVVSILPTSGIATGGTDVTITGTGFANQATVALSGSFATNVDIVNDTTIHATTPNLAPGQLHDLAVTNTDQSIGFMERAWLADFLDVPQADIFHDYVEAIVRAGITAGCGGGNYCRDSSVTRAQMAVFLLKAKHGQFYLPPDCTGVFDDVPCPSTFADWIEQLVTENITVGCGGTNYCPNNPVRRDQMAVFLLKAKHGSGFVPPDCTGVFPDVACPSTFANWIEELVTENITAGCGGGNYCPLLANTRGQMAVFLTKTFGLPLPP